LAPTSQAILGPIRLPLRILSRGTAIRAEPDGRRGEAASAPRSTGLVNARATWRRASSPGFDRLIGGDHRGDCVDHVIRHGTIPAGRVRSRRPSRRNISARAPSKPSASSSASSAPLSLLWTLTVAAGPRGAGLVAGGNGLLDPMEASYARWPEFGANADRTGLSCPVHERLVEHLLAAESPDSTRGGGGFV